MKSIVGIILFILCMDICVLSQEQNQITAFKNVNLLTMTSDKVLPHQTVIICNERIVEIGYYKKVKIPENALIIDGTGKYLMPGLADMHTHYGETLEKSYLNLFIAYGVTTIRDLPQGYPPSILKMRQDINSGERLGPQIFVANHIMGIEPDPVQLVRSSKSSGYDAVKLNSYFTTEEFIKTVNEANKSSIYTLGHMSFLISLEEVINSGYKEASHVLELLWYMSDTDLGSISDPEVAWTKILSDLFGQFDQYKNLPDEEIENICRPAIKSIVEKIGDTDFSFCTTLITDYDIMNKMMYIDTIKNSSYAQYISKTFWDDLKSGNDKHVQLFSDPVYSAMVYKMSCLILKELIAQKKFLVLGTDVGPTYLSYIPGLSVHQELALLVDNGLTPYQALTMTTSNASLIAGKMCGKDDFGTIESGRRADLLMLEDNPLLDISNTLKINGVFIQGKFFASSSLDSIKNISKQGIRNLVMECYNSKGVDAAIQLYHNLKEENYYNQYFYNENTLNIIGYDLLKMDATDDALKIFKLNVEEYPYAPNVYDSLGEIYVKLDQKEKAIESYKKALSLDPGFVSSINALKVLE